jgi:Na+/H+ antiporter NhaC
MVALMPVVLLYTGWPSEAALTQAGATGSLWVTLGLAVREGSGSMAVLTAVSASLVVSAVMYRAQGVMSAQRIVDTSLKGIGGLMPLALMMVLAFALSTLCKQLGTGAYVAQLCEAALPVALYAPVVFVVGALIAFSTGTSWGTFAIMIPIAVPLALSSGLNPSLLVAAALGGGVFGDHASPISDTTLVSSMAAATDHLDHVRTQLPMALVGAGVSVAGYVLLSLF